MSSRGLGGDEFAALLPETDQDSTALTVVRKVQGAASGGHATGKLASHVQYWADQLPHAPESVEEMVRQADAVMYSVKLKGKNSVAVQAIV